MFIDITQANDEKENLMIIQNKQANQLNTAENRIEAKRSRIKDKSDFSVLEQVLDLKTKKIIQKLIKNDKIGQVLNTISSGKEAVVYQTKPPQNYENKNFGALKIFKITSMDFRKREKYFCGDFRFRNQNLRSNVRKMVKLWAEKEFRNLKMLLNFNN
ncbi:hypothetical protein MHBO_002900 [Bonamia ostreae]|uniref:non-specific serine/threonine protein kinase n=1 Tax=Bonamia ostreae TaxID=126728 RepID=A0ABV2ANW4_9EUKA